MKKSSKIILYSALLIIGLLTFILEVFVFQKPDGFLGFIICLISIYLIIGSIIRLCMLDKKAKNIILSILESIFWIP